MLEVFMEEDLIYMNEKDWNMFLKERSKEIMGRFLSSSFGLPSEEEKVEERKKLKEFVATNNINTKRPMDLEFLPPANSKGICVYQVP
jgi:hypothetical protein